MSARRSTVQFPRGQHSPMAQSQAVTITVDDARRVSGLLQVPPGARICYVLAHGAGAGMSHPFMAAVADGLAERGIATMRYQFPYMEQGSKRPDAPKLAQATVRAAVSSSLSLGAQACSCCWRQVVWRPHDFASPSRLTVTWRPRPSLPRLPPSSRGTALGRACNSPVRGEDSDAIFARNA